MFGWLMSLTFQGLQFGIVQRRSEFQNPFAIFADFLEKEHTHTHKKSY